MFQKPVLFQFSGKEATDLVGPLDQVILSADTIERVTCQDIHPRTDLVQG